MNHLARSAALAALLLLAACNRVTPENYGKIQDGMTHEEVYAILGRPDKVGGGGIGPLEMSTESWQGHGQTITLTFGNGKVVIKAIGESEQPAEAR